jgi:glucosamine kinase
MRIGVDGGGTTTRAVVIDENARALGRGEADTSNHYRIGLAGAAENIARAVEIAMGAAQTDGTNVAFFGLGLAGACTETEQSALRTALEGMRARLFPAAELVVDEDVVAALAGAFAPAEGEQAAKEKRAEGAVCIAGTGANCFGMNAEGTRARADGLGPLLGDRGSGYWIGTRALQAACSANDGSGAPTRVLAASLAHFEVDSVDELVQLVYRPDFVPSRVASLFPVVWQCAEEGDEIAASLLRAAGEQLARTALCVLSPLKISRVALTGGVFSRETPVRAAFEAALKNHDASIEIREPQRDAAVGAALLNK